MNFRYFILLYTFKNYNYYKDSFGFKNSFVANQVKGFIMTWTRRSIEFLYESLGFIEFYVLII